MKAAWIAVLALVVVAGSAWASPVGGFTPREMGMGGASIGVADDAAAWYQNPAGLGALNLAPVDEEKLWAHDIVGSWMDAGDPDGLGLTWSGWQPAKMLGFGAGVADLDIVGTGFGAGFGMNYKQTPFSFGVNIINEDPDGGDDETFFNIGLMYRVQAPDAAPIRLGLVIADVTDESDNGPFFNLGVAWPATPQLLIAADVEDITDESDNGPFFDVGAEFAFGEAMEWKGRAGLTDTGDDHDLTLGLGYDFASNWRIDAAWQNADIDDVWSIGAGFIF